MSVCDGVEKSERRKIGRRSLRHQDVPELLCTVPVKRFSSLDCTFLNQLQRLGAFFE